MLHAPTREFQAPSADICSEWSESPARSGKTLGSPVIGMSAGKTALDELEATKRRRGGNDLMTGDSLGLPFPLSHRSSDSAETASLYRELRKPLLRYLVCLGLSRDEAQDTVQDVFLALHRHISAGGSQENLRGWAFRVAHNQARNRQSSYGRKFAAPLDDQAESIAHERTPECAVLAKERLRRLDQAIRSLPDSERECLLLRAAGLRYREIGEALDLSTSTVADIVDRSIKKLAEKCNV